jgi:hypothetical protein
VPDFDAREVAVQHGFERRGRELPQVRRVLLEPAARKEQQPVLEAEGVGHGTNNPPAWPQHAGYFLNKPFGKGDMFHDLPSQDEIERLGPEGKAAPEIGQAGSDPPLVPSDGEGFVVDIKSHGPVRCKTQRGSESPVAAPKIENPAGVNSDEHSQCINALLAPVDEAAAPGGVMRRVPCPKSDRYSAGPNWHPFP